MRAQRGAMTIIHSTETNGVDGARPRRDRLVLTIAEAAELLGISRAFAYELAAQGGLPTIRLGRRRLVPRRALLAMVGEDPDTADRGSEHPAPALVYRLVAEPAEPR